MRLNRLDLARLIALLLPLALLAGAFGSQYLGGLYPCEMCWWQRYAHMAAALIAALAFTAPAGSPRARALTLLAAARDRRVGRDRRLSCRASSSRSSRASPPAPRPSKAGTSTEDLLRQIVAAPLVRCDQVQWSFLGISMAGWNAILSLGGAAVIAFLTLRGSRR